MKKKTLTLLALLSALLLLISGCATETKGVSGDGKKVRIAIRGEAGPEGAILSSEKGALVVDPRKVTTLYLSSPSNEDLKALKHFVNLKFLRLDNSDRRDKEELYDLSPFADLPLVGLSLAGFDAKRPLNLESLEPLGKIETLSILDLEFCQVTRVESLKNLTGLRRLFIRDGRDIRIEDLSELAGLTHLGEVSREVEEARSWKFGPYAQNGDEPLLGLLISNGNSQEEVDAVRAAITENKAARAGEGPDENQPEPAPEVSPAPADPVGSEQSIPLYYFMESSTTAYDASGNLLVSYTLEAYDSAGRLVWDRTWANIQPTMTGVSDTYTWDGKVFKEIYGTLYCLDVRSGAVIWVNSEDVGGGVTLCPYNGRLYLTNFLGDVLVCLDKDTGAKIWAIEDSDKYWGCAIHAEDGVVTALFGEEGAYISVDAQTGETIRGGFGYTVPDKTVSWNMAFASSVLENNDSRYGARNVLDGNPETAWSEGAAGYGVGEWIQIERDTPAEITKIHIRNGYHKFPETYDNNGRLKAFRLDFSDGSSLTYAVDAHEFRGETDLIIPLSRPVSTRFVRLTILDAFEGERFEDTCISDIIAYTR